MTEPEEYSYPNLVSDGEEKDNNPQNTATQELLSRHLKTVTELYELKRKVNTLFSVIASGDAEHRKWLSKTIKEHFADQ